MMYLWILYVVLVIICLLIPADRIYATALTLLPIVTMFIYVIVSKDFVQGFVFGTLLAYLAYYKISEAATFVDDITNTLADYDTMFTILTFFVCGGTISALTDSGAAKSFGKWVASKIKNEKVSLIVTWLLTLGLSIDDYIDPLTVGTAMTPITDAQRIPREMPAFISRSSSSAPGLFYPMGDWAYFIIMQLVALGLVSGGTGAAVKEYMGFVPFMFYPMIAIVMALLVILGIVPKIGNMKKAYERVANGGSVVCNSSLSQEDLEEVAEYENKKDLHPANFLIPVLSLFVTMFITDFDGVRAGAITLSVTGLLYISQGIYSIKEYVEVIMEGFKDMIDLVILLILVDHDWWSYGCDGIWSIHNGCSRTCNDSGIIPSNYICAVLYHRVFMYFELDTFCYCNANTLPGGTGNWCESAVNNRCYDFGRIVWIEYLSILGWRNCCIKRFSN